MVNKLMKKLYGIFLAIAILANTALAQKEVYLKLESSTFEPILLNIRPFITDGSYVVAEELYNTLVNDLELSGFFRVNSPLASLVEENPQGLLDGFAGEAKALIEGEINSQDAKYDFTLNLRELPTKQIILHKKWHSTKETTRYLAHEVADEIAFYLVGEKGVAMTRIAFVKAKGNAKEIFSVDYDGFNAKQLTFNGSLNLSPSWSPDGNKIVYNSFEGEKPQLQIVDLESKATARFNKPAAMQTAPAWSPDGKKIALTLSTNGNAEIYVMDANGKNLRRLTNSPAIDSSPSWSPDGREIAFTSDRSGSPQIYLMDAEGGNVRRLTFAGNYNDSPAWSPRGDLVAHVTRTDLGFQIRTINVIGENLRQLTSEYGNHENPCWSPDGLKLTFASNKKGKWDIYVMNIDGSGIRQVTSDGGNVSPKWSPRLKRGG